ncbi:MAG: NAD-dependent epimerase/dehydratase family protein [Candidatus Omnitrophica bacterium]|nr:NAD-dependent epimerase/dehydratase family protein [Candidatus Omnitrophota bacterium]
MPIKNRTIFITGGAGFIGTSIVERFIGHNRIVVYDTLQRNALGKSAHIRHKNLTLVKGNVLDEKKLKRAMRGADIVLHLAAIAGIDTVIKSPTSTMQTNMIGTYNVLKACAEIPKLKRFIDFSTSEVYGSYAYKLEEHDATNMGAVGEARWTYAISKLAGEHLAHGYYREFGLPVISIRPFNIYGPRQVGEGAIHVFVTRALRNEDIMIHGDGDQIRSWCYIDDIVHAILLCIKSDKAVGEVFNIGNPRGTITILSLAQKIVELAASSSRILFTPKNYVDVELRIPDIDKARRLIGYAPLVDLNEGLKRTIDWYRATMHNR